MSTDLAGYISALIETLGAAEPAAVLRMRQVVGERRARIVLDDEAVDVWFTSEGLRVERAGNEAVAGTGVTDSATVVALLDGVLEITDAILDGRLRVGGEAQDVTRMFTAIEILLDASPRVPDLQRLARHFRSEHSGGAPSAPSAAGAAWYPFSPGRREEDLLRRHGLL